LFGDRKPFQVAPISASQIDGLEAQFPITNRNTYGGAAKESGKALLGLDNGSHPARG
jgi:hypothetical protein